jgi:hypothetical protein
MVYWQVYELEGRKTARIIGIPNEIRTKHLPDTHIEWYSYAKTSSNCYIPGRVQETNRCEEPSDNNEMIAGHGAIVEMHVTRRNRTSAVKFIIHHSPLTVASIHYSTCLHSLLPPPLRGLNCRINHSAVNGWSHALLPQVEVHGASSPWSYCQGHSTLPDCLWVTWRSARICEIYVQT